MLLTMFPIVVIAASFVIEQTIAAGAGRAFPIVSENYVIEQFRRINSRLEWDPTNFLVDLSGQFANCRFVGTRGSVKVDRKTPDGNSISGYVDYTDGENGDVNSVNGYLKRVIDRWTAERKLDSLIRGADRFGCSVRPGCGGEVAVSCLFSPGEYSVEPTPPPQEQHDYGNQRALAFTPEQYELAEIVTKNRWDRSFFLENLSGFETDCAMIGQSEWQFPKARTEAQNVGQRLFGNFGYARNYGSTPDALETILGKLKPVRSNRVGCSVIPDCVVNNEMFVVVSCIYEE